MQKRGQPVTKPLLILRTSLSVNWSLQDVTTLTGITWMKFVLTQVIIVNNQIVFPSQMVSISWPFELQDNICLDRNIHSNQSFC